MNVTLQMVEELNRRSASLNSKRQQQIGMYEASRQAYEKAVMGYKAKYGITVDDTNIQQEYNNVKAQLEADYTALNSQIISIETGEYKKTMVQPTQPTQEVQKPQQVNVDTVQSQVQQMTAPVQQQVQSQAQPQMQTAQMQPPTGNTGFVNPNSNGGRGAVTITPDMLNAKATPVQTPKELQGDEDSDIGVSTQQQGTGGNVAQFGFPLGQAPQQNQSAPTPQQSQPQQQQVNTTTVPTTDEDDEVVPIDGWGQNTDAVGDINAGFRSILGQ